MRKIQNYQNNKSTLFLVSTPIGNLEDITLRAINTLKSVDFIFCEDTRVSLKLLNHLEIKKQVYSYHEHNKESQDTYVLKLLSEGHDIALISDAGMPVISDPGFEIVQKALEEEYNVVPLPGANAALTALIASGIAPKPFTYFGFLDHKQSKKKQELESLKQYDHTLIFYESIHRMEATLKAIHEVLGDRYIVIGREITKKFEEFTYGKVSEVLKDLPAQKGELVIIVEKGEEKELSISIIDHVNQLIDAGEKPMDAIKKVAKIHGVKKQEVYNIYHNEN
jgi:16S rRNA (cytidine1402-2'-O)-methyltransferase